jgi:competence protein ComEC
VAEEKLIIDFWDVGQGDATVIRLPDNSLILIDVGPKGSPMVDWLADRGSVVHALILTHNDDDHAGALPSVVKMPGIAIKTVYMLLDRDKKSSRFQNVWRPVREEETKGKLKVVGLSRDTDIWSSTDTFLKVVYPSFSEGIEANSPNTSSAVICLAYKGDIKIIWSGDAPMQVVAEKCASTLPSMLHGPHHGGPVDKKKIGFKSWVEAVMPERVFVSVGTKNSYHLPSKPYLNLQASRGCQVICTEITKLCDNHHVNGNTPVLQTAALLGLRAARSGIPCRGCFRLTVTGGNVLSDPYDAEHQKRVRALHRAQCVPKP